jgi:hypothetical protein
VSTPDHPLLMGALPLWLAPPVDEGGLRHGLARCRIAPWRRPAWLAHAIASPRAG